MSTKDKVRVRPGRPVDATANCQHCGWGEAEGLSFGSGIAALSGRARHHVAKTGHIVIIHRTRASFVEPDLR